MGEEKSCFIRVGLIQGNEWQDPQTLQEPIPVDTFLQPPLV